MESYGGVVDKGALYIYVYERNGFTGKFPPQFLKSPNYIYILMNSFICKGHVSMKKFHINEACINAISKCFKTDSNKYVYRPHD